LIYADSLDEQAVSFSNLGFINGLTTNPSIIIKDRQSWGFEKTIKFLQCVKGHHFIQGSIKKDKKWFEVVKDLSINNKIEPEKFTIKLPWDPLIASEYVLPLKKLGFKVCATAVYTIQQTYTAICSNVDYIAFYFDRMKNSKIDVEKQLADIVNVCKIHNPSLRLLGASIKDVNTANELIKFGISDITLPLNVLLDYFKVQFPQDDLNRFESDYKL